MWRGVSALAAEELGVLSTRELGSCGVSHDAASRGGRNGRLHRKYRGVYAVGHAALTLEGEWLAAVKACGESAVLSHYSAAAYWRMVEWDGRDIEVTVTTQGIPRHKRIRVHRSACLERRDWVVRDGIRITTPARTAADLASQLRYGVLRRAIRESFGRRLASVRQLLELLERTGPRRGYRKLRRILADGYVPTRTELEDAVYDLIIAGGFEPPDVNKPLVIDGARIVPDFRWPEQKLVVEADGGQWHDHKLAREDDARRQALLEASGERVIRVRWDQAVKRRAQTQARLAAAGAPPHRASR